MTEAEIIALSDTAVAKANAAKAAGAEAILISCGGLRTLGVASRSKRATAFRSSRQPTAAFWAAMRLVGESGRRRRLWAAVRAIARAGALTRELGCGRRDSYILEWP